jgi:hypothetical protein
MPAPDPGHVDPASRRSRPLQHPDSGTDPGRAQPYESLYRSAEGVPPTSHRPTARHFEPWLTPPEDAADSEDTFHWLYRSEPGSAADHHPGPLGNPPEPSHAAAGSAVHIPEHAPPARRRGGRRGGALWLVLVLVLLVAAGVAVALLR